MYHLSLVLSASLYFAVKFKVLDVLVVEGGAVSKHGSTLKLNTVYNPCFNPVFFVFQVSNPCFKVSYVGRVPEIWRLQWLQRLVRQGFGVWWRCLLCGSRGARFLVVIIDWEAFQR